MNLRNIEVGDDLTGKTIYLSFPDDVYNEIPDMDYYIQKELEGTITEEELDYVYKLATILETDVGGGVHALHSKEYISGESFCMIGYTAYPMSEQTSLYEFFESEGVFKESTSSMYGIVSAVNKDNPIYKYIKIEDEPTGSNFYIEYETSSGTQTQEFDTGSELRNFIMHNKTTFINHLKVVAKLPEISTCYALFQYCTVDSIDLSEFNTSSVVNMSNMFWGCEMTTLDVSNMDTSNVTSMGGMFRSANKVVELDLSSFDTSNVTTMNHMFMGCGSLTGLDVSSFNTEKVTNMQSMFYSVPAYNIDVSGFETSLVTNFSYMFYQCKNITSLDLYNFDVTKVGNTSNMFTGCSELETIYCNDDWNMYSVTESTAMFNLCTSLNGAIPYGSSKVDINYANPTTGYFTIKQEPEPEPTGIGKILFNLEEFKKVMFNNIEYNKVVYENEVLWSKGESPVTTYPERILVSTGTQYINTGVKGKSSLKIETKMNGTVAWQQFALFGSRQSGATSSFVVWILDTNFRFDFASETNKSFYGSFVRPQPYVIKKDGRFNYIDDVLVQTNTASTFENTVDFTLFNINTGGTMDYRPSKMKMYWFKMWDNDILIRDFIPVQTGDVVDNLIAPSNCLYCRVTQQFYENQGTGTFDIEDV